MQAAVINGFGEPDQLQIKEVDTPTPRADRVLIKVLAAGVNRFDHYIREGSVTPQLPFPHVLGADAAGQIAAVGGDVTGFSVGDRVVPLTGYPTDPSESHIYPTSAAPSYTVVGLGMWGTYAQYIEVPARWVLKDDTGLSPEQVATLPMAASTSVRAVKVLGEVKQGDRVLITAGSSGVGTFAIQVAKVLGAEVATTIRNEAKRDLLEAIGADLIINTRTEKAGSGTARTPNDLSERVRAWTGGAGVDVVIDQVAGDLFPELVDLTRAQGIIVAVGFLGGTKVAFDIRQFFFGQRQIRGSLAGDIDDLRWALEQVKTGRIRPVLDRVMPLTEVADAHRLVAANQVTGNLVLQPWAA